MNIDDQVVSLNFGQYAILTTILLFHEQDQLTEH